MHAHGVAEGRDEERRRFGHDDQERVRGGVVMGVGGSDGHGVGADGEEAAAGRTGRGSDHTIHQVVRADAKTHARARVQGSRADGARHGDERRGRVHHAHGEAVGDAGVLTIRGAGRHDGVAQGEGAAAGRRDERSERAILDIVGGDGEGHDGAIRASGFGDYG